MSKTGTTNKEIFTMLGEIKLVEGKHRFVSASSRYMNDRFARIPVGKKVSCTFYDKVPTRSEQQLKYHFVLMGYLADHTGYTAEECHDALMRDKFGTKKIRLGQKEIEVRQSVSDRARFPKWKMVDLISHDLSICADMGIVVPTAEELGYIKN